MPAPTARENAWNRRIRRLFWMAGTASTLWFLSSYVLERMRETRIKALKDRKQRDLMKNHFTSLISTIAFTLYALLPTVQPQVFDAYPVEQTSQALQGLSAGSSLSGSTASIAPDQGQERGHDDSHRQDNADDQPRTVDLTSDSPSTSHADSNTDATNSLLLQNEEHGAHLSSEAIGSASIDHGSPERDLGTESWASEFTNQRRDSTETGTETEPETESEVMLSSIGQMETDDGMSSVASQSISLPPTDTSSNSPSPPSDLSRSELHSSPPRSGHEHGHESSGAEVTKRKKELWRELKVQSLTRTITTIYLLPMIYLLTSSQLAILARKKYMEDITSSLPSAPTSSIPVNESTEVYEIDADDDDGCRTPRRSSSTQPDSAQSQKTKKKGWFSSFSVDSMGLSEFVESSTSVIPNPVSYLPKAMTSYLPAAFVPSPSTTSADAERIQRENEETRAIRKEEEAALRAETERLYLTYSWWLLHEGWKGIASRVEESVERIFGHMLLKKEFTVQDWEMRFKEVRAEIEMDLSENSTIELYDFSPHILPTSDLLADTNLSIPFPRDPSDHSSYLVQLVNETREHLISADGRYLLEKGVSTLLGNLLASLRKNCYPAPHANAQIVGGAEVKVIDDSTRRLVDSLPELNRWGKAVWEGVPDSGIEAMLGIHEFESFAALVFGDWAPRD